MKIRYGVGHHAHKRFFAGKTGYDYNPIRPLAKYRGKRHTTVDQILIEDTTTSCPTELVCIKRTLCSLNQWSTFLFNLQETFQFTIPFDLAVYRSCSKKCYQFLPCFHLQSTFAVRCCKNQQMAGFSLIVLLLENRKPNCRGRSRLRSNTIQKSFYRLCPLSRLCFPAARTHRSRLPNLR